MTVGYNGASVLSEDVDGNSSAVDAGYNPTDDTNCLVVLFSWHSSASRSVSSVTWGGVALAPVFTPVEISFGGAFYGIGMYYLLAPDVASHSTVITMSGNCFQIWGQIVALKGIDTTSPIDGTPVSDVTTGNDAKTINTTATTTDQIRLGMRYAGRSGGMTAFTPGTGVTEIGDAADGDFRICTGYHIDTVSGVFGFTTTSTTGDSEALDLAAVAIFNGVSAPIVPKGRMFHTQ